MRILQLTHQGDLGGATNSITWLCQGLAARAHEVWLACRPDSLLAGRFRESPVRLVEFDPKGGPALVAEAVRWNRWMREHSIDVANAHASLDRRVLSYARILGTSARIVHTRRNVALSWGGGVRARFDVATTDAIIAVSDNVATGLLRRGMPADRVHVVRNGLPLADVKLPDPARVIALRQELGLREGVPVAGVLARRKSQEELLAAAARRGRPLEIVFAGIDEDDELRAAARELPEAVRWRCLGYRDDVADLAGLLDVFVLPSTIEGFSLALLEAMMRGLPCIATDAGGNAEALAEGAGIVYPPGDVAALARALDEVLQNADRARDLARRGHDRAVTQFDVARTVERTEAVYVTIGGNG